MQDNTSENFDLNKRQIHSGQYDVIPFPASGTWDQSQKRGKNKKQLQLI